jgi:DcaP outer membrane protein
MTRTKLIAALATAFALAIPAAAFAADEAPGVFKIPGTDSTIKIYGYVQTDVTFDFSGRDPNVEGNDWAIHIPNQPLDDSAEAKVKKNQLYMTARTSRFGFQTNTPTKIGDVGVKLEGDFNAVNLESGQTFTNSVTYRIRHAYGTVGGLLVGQTWSNFLDLNTYPDVVDFNGPGSIALVRNPMIKYTIPIAPGFSLAVAAENAPGTDGNDFGSLVIKQFQSIPDFTANLQASGSWGTASIRGVTMNFRRAPTVDIGTVAKPNVVLDPNGTVYSKQGYGGAASAAIKLGGDTLVLHGVGGKGIGRYIFNVGLSEGAATDTGTDLVLWEAAAYHAGFTHVWSPEFRSNLVWSQTFIKDNGFAKGSDNRRMDQAFVNTFYTFAKNAEFGIEYGWGRLETFDKSLGHQNRITGTFHYNFF